MLQNIQEDVHTNILIYRLWGIQYYRMVQRPRLYNQMQYDEVHALYDNQIADGWVIE